MRLRITLTIFAVASLALLAGISLMAMPPAPRQDPSPPSALRADSDPPGLSDGALRSIGPDGAAGAFCPLQHTDVQAEISGFLARVTVTQEFVNPSDERIEAVYTFPLPHNAAVDDLKLRVGERVVRGLIRKREEAQQIYQQARQAGHTAALLDQERPNIFSQSVANIPAHSPVKVIIRYVQTLPYEAGRYSFVFPMVVGPRYIPGRATGRQGGGWSPDTDRVPDASRITPPVAGVHVGRKGARAGHDISLRVRLDAGVPIRDLRSATHAVEVQSYSARAAEVTLRGAAQIPNRDFVLTYDVSGPDLEDALLTHAGQLRPAREDKGDGVEESPLRSGYFTFLLQPPDRVREEDAAPRELIFVLDTSGSMSGYPIETAKKVMRKAIQDLRAGDTFNLITFSGDTRILFPRPVEASSANIAQALRFLDGRHGGGGTEMMKAIRAALGEDAGACRGDADCLARVQPRSALRVVCFMTDGYVGNDMEIIAEVQKHPEARVFSFGIGSAVNRFLLESMARAGRGEVEWVLREEDAAAAADRFYERVHTPVLTDITVDFGDLPVADVSPARPLDLFSAQPLVLTGRYTAPARGTIRLRGRRAGRPFLREIAVDLPAQNDKNPALAQLWARRRIEELMARDWSGIQSGEPRPDVREQITQLGLEYRLMTQFTSFVAVEERSVVQDGVIRTIQVPVELPQNVSPEGLFGGYADGVDGLNVTRSFGLAHLSPNTVTSSLATVNVMAEGAVFANEAPANAVGPIFKRKDRATREAEKREREKRSRAQLEARLHPALLAVFDCWKSNPRTKCAGMKGGSVKVHVWLAADTPQLRQELQTLGFLTSPDPSSRLGSKLELVGEIAVEKLPALAALTEVRLIGLEK